MQLNETLLKFTTKIKEKKNRLILLLKSKINFIINLYKEKINMNKQTFSLQY